MGYREENADKQLFFMMKLPTTALALLGLGLLLACGSPADATRGRNEDGDSMGPRAQQEAGRRGSYSSGDDGAYAGEEGHSHHPAHGYFFEVLMQRPWGVPGGLQAGS